jgi:hypothetical protein
MRSTSISSIFLSSELHLTQGLVTLVPEVTPYYKAQSESGWQIWAFDGVFDLKASNSQHELSKPRYSFKDALNEF